MIIILYDTLGDNNFITEFITNKRREKVRQIISPSTNPKILGWFIGVLNSLFKSNANDYVICWYDFQAVLCWWICKVLGIKRKIIAINILLKNKPTLKNRIVSYMYKEALLHSNFKASITSVEYGNKLNEQLGVNIKFPLINDVYPFEDEHENNYINCGNSVFCGGNNGRDWSLMLQISKLLPDFKFTLVMPASEKLKLGVNIPRNMEIFTNISKDEFNYFLRKSSIIMLPLTTNAPAGLIVLFYAASQQKLVMTTSTPVTKEYINSETGVLCNEIDDYVQAARYYIQYPQKMEEKGKLLQHFIKTKCSKEAYVNKIINIIESFHTE